MFSACVVPRCLTHRSSGALPAGHQARATVQVCIFCSTGLASFRHRPLSSNVRPRKTPSEHVIQFNAPRNVVQPGETSEPKRLVAAAGAERVRVIATFHVVHRLKSSNAKAHAALHTIVENQAATGFGPTVRALARLQSQGLTRHEAVHAVGSVLSRFMFAAMEGSSQTDSQALQSGINTSIEALDAESWRKEYGS